MGCKPDVGREAAPRGEVVWIAYCSDENGGVQWTQPRHLHQSHHLLILTGEPLDADVVDINPLILQDELRLHLCK